MSNTLDQLKEMTIIVADTGDIDAIREHQPQDATTNPSLLLKAVQLPQYQSLVEETIAWAKSQSDEIEKQITLAADKLAVAIGVEILQIIPGKISTEVDARLSFDTGASISKARKLIDLYSQFGIDKERILIKVAATWEGIKAAEVLEQEGIECNLTLLFSLTQAIACADAKITLISPFVGRILDWHKAKGEGPFLPEEDPGVISVKNIYNYYKQYNIKTIVMGASFRNKEQIIALSGCDRLTISPNLLTELNENQDQLTRILSPETTTPVDKITMNEANFRFLMNQDAMATEKLSEGIRNFIVDQEKLETIIRQHLEN